MCALSQAIAVKGVEKQLASLVNHTIKEFKAVVLDWPLNIYTYNGCQKEFPQDTCKIVQS